MGWLDKYPKGGKIQDKKKIVVKDENDPRYQAYLDSLSLYERHKYINDIMSTNPDALMYDLRTPEAKNRTVIKEDYEDDKRGKTIEGIKPIGYNTYNVDDYPYTAHYTNIFGKKTSKKGEEKFNNKLKVAQFKAPEQKVIINNKNKIVKGGTQRDSLNLYKASQKLWELNKGDLKDIKKYDKNYKNDMFTKDALLKGRTDRYSDTLGEYISPDWKSEEHFIKNAKGLENYKESVEFINYINSLDWDEKPEIMYHTSPDLVHPSINPIGEGFDGLAISPWFADPSKIQIKPSLPKQQKLKAISSDYKFDNPIPITDVKYRKFIETIPYNLTNERMFQLDGENYTIHNNDIKKIQSREDYRKTNLRPNGTSYRNGGWLEKYNK